MIQHEFEKFLAELGRQYVSDDVKRLGNLILTHIDKLAPLGTHSGKRSKGIVKLAQREFESVSTELPQFESTLSDTDFPIQSLSHLGVGPFRGFSEHEEFNLDSRIVLLYGPNGSGKTSFCEALEYALLGELEEAEAKRIAPQVYLQNARVGTYRSPILSAKDSEGDDVEVIPDSEKYRFCFVEKNRIDDFSRIAAKMPAQQNKLIATLFGLGPFDEFVKGFSSEIDEKYIDLVGKKAVELRSKKETLKANEETIKSADAVRKELADKEQVQANTVKGGMPFSEFVQYLGTPENPGRIQELEGLLEGDSPKIIGVTKKALVNQRNGVDTAAKQVVEVQRELYSKKNEVSFRDLYNAVSKLQEISPDRCPACDTPLQGDPSVSSNPFDRAAHGLKRLEHLSQLETKHDEEVSARDISSKQLFSTVQLILGFAKDSGVYSEDVARISATIPSHADQLNTQWWDVLLEPNVCVNDIPNIATGWELLEKLSEKIETLDSDITIANNQCDQHKQELVKLRALREKVVELQTSRKQEEERISKAKQAVEQFDELNRVLIDAVESEKSIVSLNHRIHLSYQDFTTLLSKYRESLPSRLLANLGDTTKLLYNGFNRADPPGDLIEELRLPLSSGQKIQVAYRSNPKKYFDALHVMSEGHVRCLGLAILLAKNFDLKCPILLFDDPVNAIDDDHREGIRKTLFEDEYFSNTQIVLTCHGEDFYKDIQNLIGCDVAKRSQFYSFVPHDGDNRIKVDSAPTPRNYVVSAQEHLLKGNIRYALADARRALEMLGNRIWSFLNNKDKGALSITMRGPHSKPELKNLVQQLRKKLNDSAFIHPRKDDLIKGLDSLIGLNGDSREWVYLNKGTHEEEDRAEFDRGTVRTIVEAIVHLDTTLTRKI